MNVAAMTLVLPRMEWPFLKEWCEDLGNKGVDKLCLGIDRCRPDGYLWDKKPNPKYYHSDLSNAEIESCWQEALTKSRQYLDIETLDVKASPDAELAALQRRFFKLAADKIAQFDWVLFCDLDEVLVLQEGLDIKRYLQQMREHDCYVETILFNQLLFGSRWDQQIEPRPLKTVYEYNPEIVHVTKFCYRPNRCQPVGPHKTNGYSTFEREDRAVIHHFRGIEKAFLAETKRIQNFPNRTKTPLRMIDKNRSIKWM